MALQVSALHAICVYEHCSCSLSLSPFSIKQFHYSRHPLVAAIKEARRHHHDPDPHRPYLPDPRDLCPSQSLHPGRFRCVQPQLRLSQHNNHMIGRWVLLNASTPPPPLICNLTPWTKSATQTASRPWSMCDAITPLSCSTHPDRSAASKLEPPGDQASASSSLRLWSGSVNGHSMNCSQPLLQGCSRFWMRACTKRIGREWGWGWVEGPRWGPVSWGERILRYFLRVMYRCELSGCFRWVWVSNYSQLGFRLCWVRLRGLRTAEQIPSPHVVHMKGGSSTHLCVYVCENMTKSRRSGEVYGWYTVEESFIFPSVLWVRQRSQV